MTHDPFGRLRPITLSERHASTYDRGRGAMRSPTRAVVDLFLIIAVIGIVVVAALVLALVVGGWH